MSGRAAARGFTLIELLITLTIIAIMVSVGVPLYGTFTSSSDVSGATADLVGSINEARSRAISERALMRLGSLDGEWTTGWELIRVNSPGDDSDDEVLMTVRRPVGNAARIESDLTEIDFDREGRSTAGTFTVTIYGEPTGSPKRVLALNRLGRVETTATYQP